MMDSNTVPTAVRPIPDCDKLGIAAFVLSLVMPLLVILSFILCGIYMSEGEEVTPLDGLLGFMLLGSLLLLLLPLGLGVASLCRRGQQKVLPILAVVFSIGTLLFSMFFLLLGMLSE